MRAGRDGGVPPAAFGDADAVLARDGTFPLNHLMEQLVQRRFSAFADDGIVHGRDHDVDVDVAIACVAETGDREAELGLQSFGKIDQIDQS